MYCTADSSGDVIKSEVVGLAIKTKGATENEGGLCVGISAMDSPYFVNSSLS